MTRLTILTGFKFNINKLDPKKKFNKKLFILKVQIIVLCFYGINTIL